jgi:hypothetical protein
MKITLQDIFNIPTAVIYYPDKYVSVTSVSIDTRTQFLLQLMDIISTDIIMYMKQLRKALKQLL